MKEALGVCVKKAESELQPLSRTELAAFDVAAKATTYKDSLVLTTADILEF